MNSTINCKCSFLLVPFSVSFRAGNVERTDLNACALFEMRRGCEAEEPTAAIRVNQVRCHFVSSSLYSFCTWLVVERCSSFGKDMVYEERQHKRVILKEFSGPKLQLEGKLLPHHFLHNLVYIARM